MAEAALQPISDNVDLAAGEGADLSFNQTAQHNIFQRHGHFIADIGAGAGAL